ncbi:lipoprotein [Spiroplasma endosymbiont of Cantharis rufa]|uniref:lipoprotein n=1 Tax=Spiroplasma endosymbiont of Cantharis rufa TaxID=3066279 RepID=UPI0030CB6290
MKKLLSLLGTLSLVATSSATVIGCGNKTTDPKVPDDNNELIQELKVQSNEIFKKHLENNVYKNLIGLEQTEVNNKFLNKNKITEYNGKTAKELTSDDLQQLEIDIKKVLDISELTKSLNELKTINKYKILLSDVDTLVKNVDFVWEKLIIKAHEGENLYLGNVIVDYKIEIQYKGTTDIEFFNISDNFKYTSTDSDLLKKASDEFYKGITKDYFSSSAEVDKKHTNLKWNDIKGLKDESDGYGNYEKEFKDYYQDNGEGGGNGFRTSMINFIKSKYFSEISSTLPLLLKKMLFINHLRWANTHYLIK